jgi:hypothetical protein
MLRVMKGGEGGVTVTFSVQHVVHLEVLGERPPDEEYDPTKDVYGLGPLPKCRVDDGLVTQLVEWMHEEGIYPAVRGGMVMGGGTYIADFKVEDAERIVEWLRRAGCEEVEGE